MVAQSGYSKLSFAFLLEVAYSVLYQQGSGFCHDSGREYRRPVNL